MLGPLVLLQLLDIARVGLGITAVDREEFLPQQAAFLLEAFPSPHHDDVEIVRGEGSLRF